MRYSAIPLPHATSPLKSLGLDLEVGCKDLLLSVVNSSVCVCTLWGLRGGETLEVLVLVPLDPCCGQTLQHGPED